MVTLSKTLFREAFSRKIEKRNDYRFPACGIGVYSTKFPVWSVGICSTD
jgi:hypothetical protein